jgi:nicotinamidase-related amidase
VASWCAWDRHSRGAILVDLLCPDPATGHFVLKPMHSAFFQTGLEYLLQHLGVTLILTGIAAEICVFFTPNDAHMRRYRVIVPSDCVGSEDPSDRTYALRLMARLLAADTRPSPELELNTVAGPWRSHDPRRGGLICSPTPPR